MTREEAIKQLKSLLAYCERMGSKDDSIFESDCEALKIALSALRPVTREQVEKAWRGEWEFPVFEDGDANDPRCKCSKCGSIETPLARHRFCPNCGAPMTAEAVELVMKRLEVLENDP